MTETISLEEHIQAYAHRWKTVADSRESYLRARDGWSIDLAEAQDESDMAHNFALLCKGKTGLAAKKALDEFGTYLYAKEFDSRAHGSYRRIYADLHREFPSHFVNWQYENWNGSCGVFDDPFVEGGKIDSLVRKK